MIKRLSGCSAFGMADATAKKMQPESYCYLIFDQEVRDSLSAIETYIAKGIVTETRPS